MSDDEPIKVSVERIAEHLRWRLSNSNAELDFDDTYLDAAFDASRDGATVGLSVSMWNPETKQRGLQRFTLTVALADTGSAS